MSGKDQIDAELGRLRTLLKTTQDPDPVDVVVVEALASAMVREPLSKVLDGGANLVGVRLDAPGPMGGIAQLTFETTWTAGQSHISPPEVVIALVQISPPQVLKVVTAASTGVTPRAALTVPAGPAPITLQQLTPISASEALRFYTEMNKALIDWLARSGLSGRVEVTPAFPGEGNRPIASKPPGGTNLWAWTTGTFCTGLFCFDHTSDDIDWIP